MKILQNNAQRGKLKKRRRKKKEEEKKEREGKREREREREKARGGWTGPRPRTFPPTRDFNGSPADT
jgi:hypothetical protein